MYRHRSIPIAPEVLRTELAEHGGTVRTTVFVAALEKIVHLAIQAGESIYFIARVDDDGQIWVTMTVDDFSIDLGYPADEAFHTLLSSSLEGPVFKDLNNSITEARIMRRLRETEGPDFWKAGA